MRRLPSVAVAVSADGEGRQAVVLASVREARAWLSSMASPLIDGCRLGDLDLVISEIVTNATAMATRAVRSSSPPLRSRTTCASR